MIIIGIDKSHNFFKEVQELAKKHGVNVSMYSDGGIANNTNIVDRHNHFNSIIGETNYYADKLATVFPESIAGGSAGSILGYTYGDIVNRSSMLLHVLAVAQDISLKHTSDLETFLESLIGCNSTQVREKNMNDNASRLNKIALFCLGSLYPIIKNATGNKPLLAGELLLILDLMSHITMPHILTAFVEHPNKAAMSEAEAFIQPIDDMFAMLKDYAYNPGTQHIAPKPNPELFDSCDCSYCTHRRLRAKYGVKTS